MDLGESEKLFQICVDCDEYRYLCQCEDEEQSVPELDEDEET